MNTAWNNGYAGAMGWSLNAKDDFSGFNSVEISDAFQSWSQTNQIRLAKTE
jgi:hypothetical protein